MGKQQLVSLTFCLLFLIVFGPLSLSVYISSVQAQKLVLSGMKEFSARTVIRTDLVLEQAKLALEKMQQQAGRPLRIWPLVADAIQPDFSNFVVDEQQPDYVVLGDIGDRWDLALINRFSTSA